MVVNTVTVTDISGRRMTGTVTDPLLELVPAAIAGGVIAVVLGKIR